MSDEKEKKLISLDQFEIDENGHVVIKDADIAAKVQEAKRRGTTTGEQGIWGGVIVGG